MTTGQAADWDGVAPQRVLAGPGAITTIAGARRGKCASRAGIAEFERWFYGVQRTRHMLAEWQRRHSGGVRPHNTRVVGYRRSAGKCITGTAATLSAYAETASICACRHAGQR